MKHVKALAIKLVSIFVILWAILGGVYGISMGNILAITLTFGLFEYIVGDLILLRFTNNTLATIGDFFLAFAFIWVMALNMTTVDNLFAVSLIASISVAIFEYFFHKYVYRNVYDHSHENKMKAFRNLRYQTETSEELTDIHRDED